MRINEELETSGKGQVASVPRENKEAKLLTRRIAEVDALCSRICRRKMAICFRCWRTATDCHHIVGRGWANRWNPLNHLSVCRDCHDYLGTAEGIHINRQLAIARGLNKHAEGDRPDLALADEVATRLRAELRDLKGAA